MNTLKLVDLTVSVEGKTILNNFNLEINSGEIHVLMGPNGVGKSTLTKVIIGDPNYKIENGSIYYNDILLNDKSVDERSRLGIFIGMQLPPEIEGVTNADFLRTAVSIREKEKFKLFDFITNIDNTVSKLDMNEDMIHRDVNKGFSGGERKKNEVLQMYVLKPSMIMLDEIDSGLDVDSLRLVGESVMDYYKANNPGILLITHYDRILDYIKPTHVHVIKDGHIVKSGDYSLVKEIEKTGFKEEKKQNSSSIGICTIRNLKDE